MRKFIYFENEEGCMSQHHLLEGEPVPVRGWMQDECKEEDAAILEWQKTAAPGDYADHRLGTIVCVSVEEHRVNPIHNHLNVTVCEDAYDAMAKGHTYPPPTKPVAVVRVVVVKKGTEGGNSTVDFLLEDGTGQQFMFMVTGALLKALPI